MSEITSAALGSAGVSLLNQGGNIVSTILANRANKDLAQYSYEQQKQMIAEQNAYNSPAAQMARYQEAGLNPNLIYGQISSGNQSSIAKYESPTMQSPKVDLNSAITGAQTLMSLKRASQDIRNAQRQELNLMEQNGILEQERISKMLDNVWNMHLLGLPKDLHLGTHTGSDIFHDGSLQFFDYFNASPRMKMYNAQMSGRLLQNDINSIVKSIKGVDLDTKGYILDNLLPEKVKSLEIQNKYSPITNQLRQKLLELEVKMYPWLKGAGAAGSIIKLVK